MFALDSTAPDFIELGARALLTAMFFASAQDKFRGDPQEIAMISSLHLPAPAALERLTGVFEVLAALALLLGLGARVAAALLAAFVVFTTLAYLRYWTFNGPPDARQGMRNAFYGNWAAVGGLLLVITKGPGILAVTPSY